jgi:heme/copper-type cytochrome/quinol oxidase subunit 2
LSYAGGTVRGGVRRIPVGVGRDVQLVVTSDVADEVHVHGYDRKSDVPAGRSTTIDFIADQTGVFEVELESRSAELAQLEVR